MSSDNEISVNYRVFIKRCPKSILLMRKICHQFQFIWIFRGYLDELSNNHYQAPVSFGRPFLPCAIVDNVCTKAQ